MPLVVFFTQVPPLRQAGEHVALLELEATTPAQPPCLSLATSTAVLMLLSERLQGLCCEALWALQGDSSDGYPGMWYAECALSVYVCALLFYWRLLTLGGEGAGGALVRGWAQAVAGAAGGVGVARAAVETGRRTGGVA